MGIVRVAGLDFSLEYLRSEIHAFQVFMRRRDWIEEENTEKRKATRRGLVFIMLNLSCDVDQAEAWELFHQGMDEYYDKCDRFRLPY
jgi:hypothetical protein